MKDGVTFVYDVRHFKRIRQATPLGCNLPTRPWLALAILAVVWPWVAAQVGSEAHNAFSRKAMRSPGWVKSGETRTFEADQFVGVHRRRRRAVHPGGRAAEP